MNNAKNRIVLVLLFLTVIVSGCTGGNQKEDQGSSSLTVNEFSAFPNPVPAGQNVQFRMELVNDGAHDATNVYARLYNPPFGDSGSQVWKPTSGNMSKSYRTLSFGTLRAAGEQTPAVPKTRQVDFEPPSLGPDRDISYGFNSYILFNYTTRGTTKVQIMGEDRYREQGSPQGSAGLQNSRAPIQMEIRTPTPIPIYETTEDSVTKQFCVIARNQGSGVPFYAGVKVSGGPLPTSKSFDMSKVQNTENKIEIKIHDVGQTTFDVSDSVERNYQNVSILDGRGVGCFNMNVNGTSGTLQRTVPIRVDAYYGYRKSATTNVQVQGRNQ